MNVGSDNHLITFVAYKYFGLLDIFERDLEGNRRVGRDCEASCIVYGISFCGISISVCHGRMIFFYYIASWRCPCTSCVQGGIIGK